jgi:hypothetical protein
MPDYADLELGIHRWDADSYSVELRFTQPESDADIRLARGSGQPNPLRLDQARLLELASDPAGYGAYLGAALFADRELESAFDQARATAQTLSVPLRARLYVGPTAPELHSVRWEALRSSAGEPLFLGEQILFSRYLTSADRQPVQPKPRGAMRALIAVASPDGLEKFQLAAVDVAGELGRATAGLAGFDQVTLGEPGQASLENLIDQLRAAAQEDRPFDILHLVCHGTFSGGTSYLWLAGPGNAIARVCGDDLVQRIRELPQRPRLVVLIACQTAGAGGQARSGDNGALAALGPRLAEAGVPAVIAMQGNVAVDLVARFVPVFFRELQRDGQIDRAVAVARGSVRDHPDAWVPALYMRFKSGRVWYVPGFGEESESFEKWPALIRYLRRGQATPVIGSFMSESLLGSSRDIARAWADTYDYPMESHEREDLPQVAQYLATKQDYRFVRDELIEYLRRELLARYGEGLPAGDKATLADLFHALGEQERQRNPADPYRILADLPLPVYVTTNAASLLSDALRAAGKDPVVEICRWNEDLETLRSIFEDEPGYQPSPERPLVFHLFGTFDEPDSLVLTEDDYFDFLIGVSQNRDLVPIVVRQALADTALLFLGFRLDDWAFRVVFRTLMSQQGRSRRTRYTHIAGQLMPQENEVLEPERAIRYLETYFSDSDISIYWGSARDFARELHEQLGAIPAEAREAGARRRSRF